MNTALSVYIHIDDIYLKTVYGEGFTTLVCFRMGQIVFVCMNDDSGHTKHAIHVEHVLG